jgi:5-methylcytosine-specific restriction protein A
MLREVFEKIADEFSAARQQPMKQHPLAAFVRHDAAQAVSDIVARSDLKIDGSPGQGNWAEVPWIGLFHPEVTTSATRGYYVVYLFAVDMSSVSLCLGQGVTAIREEFKAKAIDEMLRRAALIRDRLPTFVERFVPGPLELGGRTQLAKDYDTAVAFYRPYDIVDMPDEGTLMMDLRVIVSLYDLLVSRGGLENIEGAIEAGADQDELEIFDIIEERRRYVRHNRIDRQSAAAKQAKKAHGYVCQACGFDFARVYGELGENYIEAHHLIPLSSLPEGTPVPMDPKTDFAVLCANCHRMVHRNKEPLSVRKLKALLQINQS